VQPWDYVFGPVGAELRTYDETYRPPVEAVETARIATAVGGDVYQEGRQAWVELFSALDRSYLESELSQSIWIAALGLLFGAVAWRLLAHGLAGPMGREHALVIGAAVATPFLIVPAVMVGTPAGIAAGFLVPASLALLLGLSLARRRSEAQWTQTAMAAALVAAALLVVLVVRDLTSPSLPGDPGTALLVIAAIGLAPAAIAALERGRGARERAGLMSLGLVPAAASTVVGTPGFNPLLPLLLVAGLVGWQVLPIERAFALAGSGFARFRSAAPAAGTPNEASTRPALDPIVDRGVRDALTLALFAMVALAGISGGTDEVTLLGILLGAVVWLAIRSGFLGTQWADAAVPLAVAVGLPVSVSGHASWLAGGGSWWTLTAVALAGVSVAHVLAARHSDPTWRSALVWIAAALVIPLTLIGRDDIGWAFLLAAIIPLVPGLPVAFAADHDEPRAISTRLETLVVALTPIVAALVLTPLAWVPLVAWLIAIVVWRRFTLAPLLGLAQRTQLQRDLAVAAAETERARLAADLHDDALQQLTMLVRTLDEGGHKKEAKEAREVATKLRSVVGDLRLPLLDDLGAGAALEWLVERVEPLAGGPVKLERSDETRRPPANVELAVFRVAQEALTNAIKHGKPPIAVHYDVRADGRVTLAVDDAGSGIGDSAAEEAPRQGHFGLANMQQRAEQIGALLDVRRWPAGGTRVALEWRPQ
jgi:signal transduction histidine kinase